MTQTERIQRMLTANPKELAQVDRIFSGADTSPRHADRNNRLVHFTEAAKMLNVSRPTVYALVRAGRLETVPLCGVSRITVRSINAFVDGANGGAA